MKDIQVGKKRIGDHSPCFIIAEAGVNHNGDLNLAKKLIDEAAAIESDAIKFQTFKTEEGIIKNTKKARYQIDEKNPDETQYQMIKKLEFTQNQWLELTDYAKEYDLIFFSKPNFEEIVDLLHHQMQIPLMKIGSGEVTYLSLIKKVAKTGLPTILSTGMSTLSEVELAVSTFRSSGNEKLILMHCTSNYPAEYNNLNLRAMRTLKYAFNCPVGYSDHSLGIHIPIAAVTLGACTIEKHFTLSKKMDGPDHRASLEPLEFRQMIQHIRDVEVGLGNSIKQPTKSEQEIRNVARRSIVAAHFIPKKKIITSQDLKFKRPGTGIPQKYSSLIVGRESKCDIQKDEILRWNMI